MRLVGRGDLARSAGPIRSGATGEGALYWVRFVGICNEGFRAEKECPEKCLAKLQNKLSSLQYPL